MPIMTEERKTERLDIRTSLGVMERIRDAALLGNMPVSTFVIEAAVEKADRQLECNRIYRFSREGQIAFAEALLRGRQPDTPAMLEAKRLNAELFDGAE